MAKIKYNEIYLTLKNRIEERSYGPQELIPSENALVKEFGCSRNTIRRSVGQLALEGYVQSIHGKGVRVIYQPMEQPKLPENLKEAVAGNHSSFTTKVICFAELTVDEKIRDRTGFPMGTEIYSVQRVWYLEGEALMIDHSYYRRDVVKGLTPEIAEQSVYQYMEKVLGQRIVTAKRKITVEQVTEMDKTYLDLKEYNCVAVINRCTYNGDGILFEFNQSRHRPDGFVFYDSAHPVKREDSRLSMAAAI